MKQGYDLKLRGSDVRCGVLFLSSTHLIQFMSYSSAATTDYLTKRVCGERIWRLPRSVFRFFTTSAKSVSFSCRSGPRMTAGSAEREQEDLKRSTY